MIKEAILKITKKISLSENQAQEVFREIFEDRATPSQIGAFLAGLSMKEETPQEMLGAVKIVREKSVKIKVRKSFLGIRGKDDIIFDTCGTGGSGVNKFNISTAVGFVLAAAGITVAKHGNRAASSSSGSADCLEELGIRIDISPEITEEAIERIGIGFLFAPLYHPVFKKVAQIRKEIGIRTIFNIIGPLCNPASPTHQILGVADSSLMKKMATVLKELKIRKALLVHSKDLGDEISASSKTEVIFIDKGRIKKGEFYLKDFGIRRVPYENFCVNNAKESARIIKDIFEGRNIPPRYAVLVNAAAGLFLAGKVSSLREGLKLASLLIDSGKVKEKFNQFRDFLQKKS